MAHQGLVILFALMAAVCMAIGIVVRQRATMDVPEGQGVSTAMVTALVRKRLWWIGTGVAVTGYMCQALALAKGSLLVVQPLLMSSLLFALPLSARLAGRRVSRSGWTWAVVLTIALTLYLSKTFTGRAIKAVAQDEPALRLMGADPVRIKQWAFGIATAVTALGGALLIIVGPVEPAMDRLYIGRTFCVVVLAGLGSMTGTLAAGLLLGISESIVLMHFGASWAPAVAFGLLLIVLGIRPQGLFGR